MRYLAAAKHLNTGVYMATGPPSTEAMVSATRAINTEGVRRVIAIIDNNGYVLAPVPVAPVNETDMVLLPKGLHALKQVATEVGLDLRGAYLNLDGGFDSARNRKCIFNAGIDSQHQGNTAQWLVTPRRT